jgi:hypothetical protein
MKLFVLILLIVCLGEGAAAKDYGPSLAPPLSPSERSVWMIAPEKQRGLSLGQCLVHERLVCEEGRFRFTGELRQGTPLPHDPARRLPLAPTIGVTTRF